MSFGLFLQNEDFADTIEGGWFFLESHLRTRSTHGITFSITVTPPADSILKVIITGAGFTYTVSGNTYTFNAEVLYVHVNYGPVYKQYTAYVYFFYKIPAPTSGHGLLVTSDNAQNFVSISSEYPDYLVYHSTIDIPATGAVTRASGKTNYSGLFQQDITNINDTYIALTELPILDDATGIGFTNFQGGVSAYLAKYSVEPTTFTLFVHRGPLTPAFKVHIFRKRPVSSITTGYGLALYNSSGTQIFNSLDKPFIPRFVGNLNFNGTYRIKSGETAVYAQGWGYAYATFTEKKRTLGTVPAGSKALLLCPGGVKNIGTNETYWYEEIWGGVDGKVDVYLGYWQDSQNRVRCGPIRAYISGAATLETKSVTFDQVVTYQGSDGTYNLNVNDGDTAITLVGTTRTLL